jgi:hypothetical protein
MATWIQIILEDAETWALATLLLLSLVLPLLAGNVKQRNVAASKHGLRIVWTGQISIGLCGLLIVIFPQHALIGFVLALSTCVIFANKLLGHARHAPNENL